MSHIRIGKGSSRGGYLLPELDYRGCKAVRAGDQVFLVGATGLTMDGGFVGEGDPAAQADNAMGVVRALLEEAGARMEDICKVTTYVTDIDHRWKVYPVLAEHLRGVNPVSTGLVISGLARPELDFEIDVFAVVPRDGGEHKRFRLFNTSSKDPMFDGLDYGLARAVRANDLVYLQGQTGWTFEGDFVGLGDPAAQADNAMRCVRTLLEEAGSRMEDICKVITYVKDASVRQAVYPVLAEHMRGVRPVSTGVVVRDSAARRSISRSTSSRWLPEVPCAADVRRHGV